MDTTKLVAQAQSLAAKGGAFTDELLRMAKPDLLAALGHQVFETARGDPGITNYSVTVDLDTLDRGVFTDLGRRIFARWSRVLHDFLCKPSTEDGDLQTRILQALTGKEAGVSALIVGLLVGTFGLAPAVATLVAALVVKLIVTPATEEICKYWDEQLAAS